MSTCDITIKNVFCLNFLTGMYQKNFKECDLYKWQNVRKWDSFQPNRKCKHRDLTRQTSCRTISSIIVIQKQYFYSYKNAFLGGFILLIKQNNTNKLIKSDIIILLQRNGLPITTIWYITFHQQVSTNSF